MRADVQATKNLIYAYAELLDTGNIEGVAAQFADATVRTHGPDGAALELQGSEGARSLPPQEPAGVAMTDQPLRPTDENILAFVMGDDVSRKRMRDAATGPAGTTHQEVISATTRAIWDRRVLPVRTTR